MSEEKPKPTKKCMVCFMIPSQQYYFLNCAVLMDFAKELVRHKITVEAPPQRERITQLWSSMR